MNKHEEQINKYKTNYTNTNQQQPLDNENFSRIMRDYMNLLEEYEEVENQRTDHKLSQLSWTNTWLFIIALYCLFKLITELAPFILGASLIQKLLS